MVVEDHPDSLEITRRQVETLGATVLTASNGIEALEVARRRKPDLILCDLMMPKMDGFEFMRHLQKDPRLCNVRVLALTVLGSSDDLMKTWKAGFSGHLVKPIDGAALAAQIRRIFWAHQSN